MQSEKFVSYLGGGGLRPSYRGTSRKHSYAARTEGHIWSYYIPNGFLLPTLLPNCFTFLGICNIRKKKKKKGDRLH